MGSRSTFIPRATPGTSCPKFSEKYHLIVTYWRFVEKYSEEQQVKGKRGKTGQRNKLNIEAVATRELRSYFGRF